MWFGAWWVGLGLVQGWFRVGLRWVSGGFGVWVDLGLGLGLRRGCRVVWFRVGCCERCGGVGSRGERGSLGPKLQGSHGTGQHPQHCQHHPQDADDAGEWGGPYHLGGGGGYVAQGLVHIYIYIYLRVSCRWVACPAHLRVFVSPNIYIYIYIPPRVLPLGCMPRTFTCVCVP